MADLTGMAGFTCPAPDKTFSKRRAGIELAATTGLAISLAVAATAVSIGMVHSQALGTVAHHHGTPLAIAAGLGLAMVGGSSMSAIVARDIKPERG